MEKCEKVPYMIVKREPMYGSLSEEDLSRVLNRLLDLVGIELQTEFFKLLADGSFDSCFYEDEAKGKVHDIALKCFVEPYSIDDHAKEVAITLVDDHWQMEYVPVPDMGEVDLEFMDDVCPVLDKIVNALAMVPDMCDESQRECLDEMAVTLRMVAGVMSKAARGVE